MVQIKRPRVKIRAWEGESLADAWRPRAGRRNPLHRGGLSPVDVRFAFLRAVVFDTLQGSKLLPKSHFLQGDRSPGFCPRIVTDRRAVRCSLRYPALLPSDSQELTPRV